MEPILASLCISSSTSEALGVFGVETKLAGSAVSSQSQHCRYAEFGAAPWRPRRTAEVEGVWQHPRREHLPSQSHLITVTIEYG